MVKLSVTVDDGHLPILDAVVARLRAHGMEVDQVLEGLGVITGSAPSGVRESLTAIEGVVSVDEQLTHRLPPPDAPVQ